MYCEAGLGTVTFHTRADARSDESLPDGTLSRNFRGRSERLSVQA